MSVILCISVETHFGASFFLVSQKCCQGTLKSLNLLPDDVTHMVSYRCFPLWAYAEDITCYRLSEMPVRIGNLLRYSSLCAVRTCIVPRMEHHTGIAFYPSFLHTDISSPAFYLNS